MNRKKQNRACWIWAFLLAPALAASGGADPSVRFFRVGSGSNTEAMALSASGVLVWSNPEASGRFQIEWSDDVAGGTWRSYLSGPATGRTQQVKLFDLRPAPGMAYIPAGDFVAGDAWGADHTAMPVHTAWVSAFHVDRAPVSKARWDEVRAWGLTRGYTDLAEGAGGGKRVADIVTNEGVATTNWLAIEAGPEHPVVLINWYDIAKWCNARSEKEGLTPAYYLDAGWTVVYRTGQVDLANSQVDWGCTGYRLPTETEWEKAARGGLVQQHYAWPSMGLYLGDVIDGTMANYWGSGDAYDQGTTPSGYYDGGQVVTNAQGAVLPVQDMGNAYGVHDVVGNVWEFCWDVFSSTSYAWRVASGDLTDPHGPTYVDLPLRRADRGGSWRSSSLMDLRVPGRWWVFPGEAATGLNRGFRTVRRAEEP